MEHPVAEYRRALQAAPVASRPALRQAPSVHGTDGVRAQPAERVRGRFGAAVRWPRSARAAVSSYNCRLLSAQKLSDVLFFTSSITA